RHMACDQRQVDAMFQGRSHVVRHRSVAQSNACSWVAWSQLCFADHRLRRQFNLFDGLLEGRKHRQWKSQMSNRHLRYLARGCAWLNQCRRNVKVSDPGRDSPGFNGIEKYEWRVVGHGIDLQPVVEPWPAKSPPGP